jgi:predicted transcriptional regulator
LEIESLFSGTRWEILKALSGEKLSPMELANKMKTTSANISQQLRLLELANLVKSEKTANVDKGKPRIIYSLAGDTAYIILASPSYSEKRMFSLTQYHKFIMKSWFLSNMEYHSVLSDFYFKVQDLLAKIDIISVQDKKELLIHVYSGDTKTRESLRTIATSIKRAKVLVEDTALYKKSESALVLYNSDSNKEVGK